MPTDSDRRTAIINPSEHPRDTKKPRIVVIAGNEIGRQVELGDETVEIGRSEQATLRVDSDLVSRKHACIRRVLNQYVLVDLGSTNGTFVNDEKIRTRELRDGDRIRIGRAVLKYSENAAEVEYHHRIVNMARTDGLTGVFNKLHFDEVFRKEAIQCTALRRPLSLVLFDVDHFKKINDTYGHLAGDAVLRDLAASAKAVLGGDAVLCRVGGEEFAVILPGRDADAARSAAESIRKTVEEYSFTFEDRRIPVTTSAGVAELAPGEKAEDLYRRADERLYLAKRSGRNQVQ